MKFTRTQEKGKLIFALDGRLDTTTAPQFQDALIPAFDEAAHVELDLTKLFYISSAGLRVLLMGEKTSVSKGASMTLRGVSAGVMEVLDMTGFSDILTIV